jgi:hypothetical protein
MPERSARGRWSPSALVAGLAAAALGCNGVSDDPCNGVNCSSRGYCIAQEDTPYCLCLVGYHPVGTACAPNDGVDPCTGVECNGHGGCLIIEGGPACVCDPGFFHPEGHLLLCVAEPMDGGPDTTICLPAGPETCNLRDDDCDGLTDEDYDIDFDAAHCGRCGLRCPDGDHAHALCVLGDCDVTCEAGWANRDGVPGNGCEAVCVPGSGDEASCDGADDDCDGLTDEDWTSAMDCGEGLCERAAFCHRGEIACQPRRPPSDSDGTCDGVDDDCDGLTDEECTGADADADADGDGDGDADPDVDWDVDPEVDVPSDVDASPDADEASDVEAEATSEVDPDADEASDVEAEAGPSCGDGTLDPAEECDDGNGTAGDGCEPGTCVFSCRDDVECRETPLDDPCTADTCEVVTGGRRCASAPNSGAACDDGRFCTGTDTCDATGTCVSTGDPCHPGIETCVEASGSCEPTGTGCWIDLASYAADAANPANPCEWCRPASSFADWTVKSDFSPCSLVTSPYDFSYDICSGGVCISPGTCGGVACNAPGPNWTVPDTNMRRCYDSSGTVLDPCPGTAGTSACSTTFYCGQDAQYGWDTTHAAVERFTSTSGSAESIVTDRVTGLVWQGCVAGRSGAFCTGTETTFLWLDAIRYCDGLAWGGYSDWRVPDRFELQTIVNWRDAFASYSEFVGTPWSTYWTASASSSTQAWYQRTDSGHVYTGPLDTARIVRCVQSPAPGGGDASARFVRTTTVPEQPVVDDARTGIGWQGCSAGSSGPTCTTGSARSYSWSGALNYCEGLSWGGSTDWYLPNIDELGSIVNDRRSRPAIDVAAFPGTPTTSQFWSATSSAASPDRAADVGFSTGDVSDYSKGSTHYVRCVRRRP